MTTPGPQTAIEWMPTSSSHALARVSLVAATGGFLFGYDTAVINGANQYLTAHFGLSSAQEGFAAASAILGCIPGALLGGSLSDRFGRKAVLLLCAILFLLSGIASALPTNMTEFLIARFLGGIGIGISSMVCPVYIGECAPAAHRGRLGTLFQLGIVVGIFLTLFLNSFIQGFGDQSWNAAIGWRWMLGSEAVPACLLLWLLRRAPESPRWLIQQGRDEDARNILARWADASTIESEIAAVRAVTRSESGRLSELVEPRFRRPLIIAVGIAVVAQLSGINAILYYSTKIFMTAGVGISDAFTATVLVGFVNLLFTLAAVALMDRAGRRALLLVGLAAQVLSLFTVAYLLGTHSSGLALLLAVLIFIAAFALALGPISWLLGSEIFPARIRGSGMSVMAFTTWVGCYSVAQTFPILNDNPAIGSAKTFCIYAAASLTGLAFTFFLVPETKGRTLEEIDAFWSNPR
jgi:MFS transporter, SP family, arabinose:H+ symporter